MWTEKPLQNVPQELAAATTSLWQYNDVVRVGVIRGSTFLVPPYLWAEVLKPSLGALRQGKKMLNEFQQLTNLPVVFAETDPAMPANADFLQFVGFELISTEGPRYLFKRSII